MDLNGHRDRDAGALGLLVNKIKQCAMPARDIRVVSILKLLARLD
jgi:hypothetical protein